MIEAKEIVVETCGNIVKHYAKKHNVEDTKTRIRIDLEKIGDKPVFGIFNLSTVLERQSLKEIIRSGGGGAFSMILGSQIRKIVNEIFSQSLKQLELADPKQIFLLLYLKRIESVTNPEIALYKNGEYVWSLPIAEVMDASLQHLGK